MLKKIIIKNILITITTTILLNGCSFLAIHNPGIEDIKGKWESTAFGSYSVISIRSESEGKFIMIMGQGEIKLYTLSSFIPKENEIELKFTDSEKKEQPVTVSASIVLDRLVITSDKQEPDSKLWFIRAENLSKYQEAADRILKDE